MSKPNVGIGMDKEAQGNMEQLIIAAMTNYGEYQVEDVGEHATEIAGTLIFNGYRKLPEGEPPLLGEEDNPFREAGWSSEFDAFEDGKEAQRDSDIKWYEGVMIEK